MRIIVFIENEEVIERTLKYLGLWDRKARPRQGGRTPVTISIDDSDSQVPFSAPSFYPDPEYSVDSCYDWGVFLTPKANDMMIR